MRNVYYDPQDYGLQEVAEISYTDGAYEFDLRVVWGHKETGKLYTARDSGCSCPSPFEDYRSLEALDDLGDGESVIAEAKKQKGYHPRSVEDTSYFIRSVRRLVRAAP